VNLHQIIRKPLVTEKSNIGREERNVVTLAVDPRANKHEVKRAVQELFGVDVLEVRTMRMPAKTRRVGRYMGRKPQWKKAIVRLAEGQKIEFFEGV
jgi:large subunit ribosomal protein L23